MQKSGFLIHKNKKKYGKIFEVLVLTEAESASTKLIVIAPQRFKHMCKSGETKRE